VIVDVDITVLFVIFTPVESDEMFHTTSCAFTVNVFTQSLRLTEIQNVPFELHVLIYVHQL
jgi:hypothetical protein